MTEVRAASVAGRSIIPGGRDCSIGADDETYVFFSLPCFMATKLCLGWMDKVQLFDAEVSFSPGFFSAS
jgi:hypothetical protein